MKKINPSLFPQIQYLHGTGGFAHNFGNHKYAGVTNGIRASLNEILENGLKPFPDPLNRDYSASISLTEDVRYALLYALLYAEKGTSKQFGINRGKEWFRVLRGIFKEAKPFKTRPELVGVKNRHVRDAEFRKWTYSFNNEDYQTKWLGALRGMVWGESNISGNFPVVIGVKTLDNIEYLHGWNEVRTKEHIPPEKIAGIFVPRQRIGSIKNSTNLPVYAIEDLIQSLED